jgi:hypothetical protein
MIDWWILVNIILTAVFFIIAIYMGTKYFKYRSKNILAVFIITIIYLVLAILDLIFAENHEITKLLRTFGIGSNARIVLNIILLITMIAFLFYPQIQWFFNQRSHHVDLSNNPDTREEIYQNKLTRYPQDVEWILRYAIFLWQMRKDYDRAEKDLELELELWFYRYAVFFNEFPDSEEVIKNLLQQDVKLPEKYLKDILESAKKKGHPDYEKLSNYESRIFTLSECDN